MTTRRYDVLLRALTRAADEWEAEANHLDNYGEGPQPDARRDLSELRKQISQLDEARAIIVADYGRGAS